MLSTFTGSWIILTIVLSQRGKQMSTNAQETQLQCEQLFCELTFPSLLENSDDTTR